MVRSCPAPRRLLALGSGLVLLAGCVPDREPPVEELWWPEDDPIAYIDDVAYGRAVLERDLTSLQNEYAQRRLSQYGRVDGGWSQLPSADPPSHPLRLEDVEALVAGEPLDVDPAAGSVLVPAALPDSPESWVALGERVFFEYPLRADSTYTELTGLEGALQATGFIEFDGAIVGLRLLEDPDGGGLAVGPTCAQCHSSLGPAGEPTGQLSNREMDVGAARLLVEGLSPGELPPELDSTAAGDWDRLGPGRTDVLPDGVFNPYAFPDFGGLRDLPYLHHNANWHQRGTATLAVRCETLFVTAAGEQHRIPRVLAWALAEYIRSLPAPPPLRDRFEVGVEGQRGAEVFEEAGCEDCHAGPLYSSDRQVDLELVGTESSAGLSPARATGHYRIPSLRGVGRTAPYLHHGVLPTLEAMFDPDREEPGHEFGLDLSEPDRQALLAFLESI